jgi:hypothetical protein
MLFWPEFKKKNVNVFGSECLTVVILLDLQDQDQDQDQDLQTEHLALPKHEIACFFGNPRSASLPLHSTHFRYLAVFLFRGLFPLRVIDSFIGTGALIL